MNAVVERPLPTPRGEEKQYFADLREHRMPYYCCADCSSPFSRPRERCVNCAGPVARQWSTGEGTVYSFTTVHRPGHPWFADSGPYTIAIVEFAEGFRGLADLRLPPYAQDPYIGQSVSVEFEDVTPDITLAHFVAAQS